MWDPVSVMIIMWYLGAGLPDGRLNTIQTIEDNKQAQAHAEY